jgi:small conductance mechanosensitive channel
MAFDLQSLQELVFGYGVRIIGSILIFLVGKWLVGKVTALLEKVLERQKVDVTLVKFLKNILYYILLTAVLIAAAGHLGINTTSFLAIIGAATLAIGLALKDSLANFSSGVMLILFRPFRVGDFIAVAGESGTVQEISVFHTVLHTGDNQKKIIPNGAISNSTITNITANPTRRIDLTIGIGYDDDIRKAKESLEKILAAEEKILTEPAPLIAVSELGESSVNLVVRPWVRTADYWGVYFRLTEKIKMTFDDEGISFPFPQRDLHVYSMGSNGAAVAVGTE